MRRGEKQKRKNPSGEESSSARLTGYASGEGVDEPVTFGDPALAERLSAALLARGDVDRHTHGFHTYPAGLHADAAAILVRSFSAHSLLDPFVGGGTTLVEGRLAGLRTWGRDVSPVALLVANMRTSHADEALLTRVRSTARKATERARSAQDWPDDRLLGAVREWYAPHALVELESIRQSILEADEELQPLLWGCFSSILIKVSWRRSDTSGQRVKHNRPPGTTAVLFHKKVRELGRRIAALREDVPPDTPDTDLQRQDARELSVPEPVDLVVTSPPYPSTYDYLALQHLRRLWLGLPVGEGEIGTRKAWREGERRARRQWRADTAVWTQQVADQMAPGAHLVVVIGDGITPAGTVDASEPTESAGKAAGLSLVARASVERVDHARESTRWEHAFAFKKPEESADVEGTVDELPP